jgi:hypothetical protein
LAAGRATLIVFAGGRTTPWTGEVGGVGEVRAPVVATVDVGRSAAAAGYRNDPGTYKRTRNQELHHRDLHTSTTPAW